MVSVLNHWPFWWQEEQDKTHKVFRKRSYKFQCLVLLLIFPFFFPVISVPKQIPPSFFCSPPNTHLSLKASLPLQISLQLFCFFLSLFAFLLFCCFFCFVCCCSGFVYFVLFVTVNPKVKKNGFSRVWNQAFDIVNVDHIHSNVNKSSI